MRGVGCVVAPAVKKRGRSPSSEWVWLHALMPLSLDRIAEASHVIDPVFRNTPQFVDAELSRQLRREFVVKVECLNPIRSFKGRGADYLVRGVEKGCSLVCASAGNFGQGLAYAAAAHSVPVTVFAATTASPNKVARMRELGADVRLVGNDFDEAKALARDFADENPMSVWVEDGDDDRVTEGAATIGVELAPMDLDAVVVPVGNGALINGVATWLATHSPRTRVVGACAAGAPSMQQSWQQGAVVQHDRIATFAEGVGVRIPIPEAVDTMRQVVHDMVTVTDDMIMEALRHIHRGLGLVLEPAGAVGVAALLNQDIPGSRVGTVLTGSNYTPEVLNQVTASLPGGSGR
jgi:threonine dehydratase